MRRRLAAGLAVGALALAGVLAPVPASAQNRDQMTIGLSQFPSNFNPNVDSMLAKSWILYTSQRPITAFDADWKLNCVLCEELPSIAKGTAQEFTNAANARPVPRKPAAPAAPPEPSDPYRGLKVSMVKLKRFATETQRLIGNNPRAAAGVATSLLLVSFLIAWTKRRRPFVLSNLDLSNS